MIPRQPAPLRAAIEAAALGVVASLRTREGAVVRQRTAAAQARQAVAREVTADAIAEGGAVLAGLPVEDPAVTARRRRDLDDAAVWAHGRGYGKSRPGRGPL